MATSTVTESVARGGAFLIAASRPEQVFTPADLNDDQRLIGQTAEEFVTKEVMPRVAGARTAQARPDGHLLKKAGEIGLLAARFRKNTAARLSTKSPPPCSRKNWPPTLRSR